MHLIFDGYNFIRQSPRFSPLDAMDLEAGREALVAWLDAWGKKRSHHLTVVFDGWQAGGLRESRDRYGGVHIIYSRRGERADEVIKRLLDRERHRALLVSSDGELLAWAQQVGAAWISCPEFEARFGQALEPDDGEEGEGTRPAGPAKKGPAKRLPRRERQRRKRLSKL